MHEQKKFEEHPVIMLNQTLLILIEKKNWHIPFSFVRLNRSEEGEEDDNEENDEEMYYVRAIIEIMTSFHVINY